LLTDFKKYILQILNIALLLQLPLTKLAYCHSSKCPLLARTQVRRSALRQLYSVEGRAKCPTVPQRRELMAGKRAACSKVVKYCFFKCLKNF